MSSDRDMDAPKGQEQTEVVDSSVVRNDVDDPRRASYGDKRRKRFCFFPLLPWFLFSRESSGTVSGVDVVGTEHGKITISHRSIHGWPHSTDERMTTWVNPPGPSQPARTIFTVPRAPHRATALTRPRHQASSLHEADASCCRNENFNGRSSGVGPGRNSHAVVTAYENLPYSDCQGTPRS